MSCVSFIDKLSLVQIKGLSKIFGIVCFAALLVSPTFVFCQTQSSGTFEHQIVSAAENTWGYDIMMDGKLFIHQPFAPGIHGNRGFSTKEKAERAAKLVIEKINNGIMPPSLSVDEVQAIENNK
jgi:hypothetical protein